MAALDQTKEADVQVKDGVDQETVDAVREVGGKYKYGWSTDIEMEYAPKGLTISISVDHPYLYLPPTSRTASTVS